MLCVDLGAIICVSGSLGFESEDELINYYESLNDTYRDIYAVIFEGLPTDGDPGHLKYKIRLSDPRVQTSLTFDEFQSNGPGFSGTMNIEICNTLHTYTY